MHLRLMAGFLACLALTACSGRIDRGNPFAASTPPISFAASPTPYVWARNDGRRMSGNPALLSQGQKDQSKCREEAATGGASSSHVFAQCMQRRGYSARPAG
jgi:hypothetical protein